MAYLGNDLQVAYPTYKNIDDISGSFNSSATSFPLLVSGVAPVPLPLNSQQCLISVGGVVQRPDDSGSEGFRLSGGNIIFASAPATGADFFGVILAGADYVNVGANYPSGSAAVPSITFDSDLDTGIYNSAANELSFSTGGTQRLSISSAGQLSNNLGSAAAPSYSFSGDVNTGIYSPGADQVAISTNSTGRLFIDASGNVGHKSTPASWDPDSGLSAIQLNGYGAIWNYYNNVQLAFNAYQSSTGDKYLTTDEAAKYTLDSGGNHVWYTASSGSANAAVTFSEKMRITNAGLVGIGTSSVASTLHIVDASFAGNGTIRLGGGGASAGFYSTIIQNSDSNGKLLFNSVAGSGSVHGHQFQVDGTAAVTIDASRRLLVGTSTARSAGSGSGIDFQVEGAPSPCNIGAIRNSNNAFPARVVIAKTRGGSVGSNTVVQSGDSLGLLEFDGADGTQLIQGAGIEAFVDGTPGTNDMPTRLVFSTTADGASSPTERWRYSNNGETQIRNMAEVFPVTDNACLLGKNGNRWSAVWATNGTIQTSDERAKVEILNATLGTDFIKSLRPVSYKWIEGGKRFTGNLDEDNNYIYESVPGARTHWGFIAQEVKQAVDTAGVDFGGWVLTDKDDPDSQQALRYDQFIAPLTKALQEALAEIDVLKAKVAALETK